jgi:PBSX family phage portal protein
MTDQTNTLPEAQSIYIQPKERADNIFKLDGGNANRPIESNSLEYEDEFKGRYGAEAMFGDYRGAPGTQIIQPPVMPKTLAALVQQNNALPKCIDAVVTNVHGTGYEITLKAPAKVKPGEDAPIDPKVTEVQGFFDEVWPGMSFLQMRKLTGEDQEATGNAYWEVLRNLKKELVMLRLLDPKVTRLVLLSQPTEVAVTIRRGGIDITLKVMMRYRRFVQSLGTQFVFYKEYGCPLLINKKTGELLEDNAANRLLLYKNRAMGTEVIHFTAMPDVDTPYGVPKWYAQMPSVLGSRKAEEFNVDYFTSGGVPPLMIFVEGGVMAKGMKEALQEFLSSKPGAKQGAPVFEIMPVGGTLDSGGASGVRVTVEKFGSEQQKDSMFEEYDNKCEERIRSSWRLPPIFVGKSEDYNLATAQASYAVAEAQVFKPARDEFDEKMNTTIMRELDPSGNVILRSKGLPVKDVNQQLLALQTAMQADAIDLVQLIDTLNEICAMSMKLRPGAVEDHAAKIDAKLKLGQALIDTADANTEATKAKAALPAPGAKGNANGPSSSSPKPKTTTKKADDMMERLLTMVTTSNGSMLREFADDVFGMPADQLPIFKARLEELAPVE